MSLFRLCVLLELSVNYLIPSFLARIGWQMVNIVVTKIHTCLVWTCTHITNIFSHTITQPEIAWSAFLLLGTTETPVETESPLAWQICYLWVGLQLLSPLRFTVSCLSLLSGGQHWAASGSLTLRDEMGQATFWSLL